MSKKIMLKKVRSSDLSLFRSYFKNNPTAKQKGFNLDSDILGRTFFPALKYLLNPLPKKAVHVDLTIFGPGLAAAHTLARKIKIDAKNFRLNGELVDSHPEHPNRYDPMAPGDFAIMEFIGNTIPEIVNVVMISANQVEDASIYGQLQNFLPNENDSSCILSHEDIEGIIKISDPLPDHPIRQWLDYVLLEELGSGDQQAAETLNNLRRGRGISLLDLKASKDAAEKTGRLGEEFLDSYLGGVPTLTSLKGLINHEWVAQINAISPFDFLLRYEDGSHRHADAKSTSGGFSNNIYISTAEINHAINSGVPYDIFRLYEVTEISAKIKVARDIRSKLIPVQKALTEFPDGVRVDSISFSPSFFDFEDGVGAMYSFHDEDDETV